MGIEKKVHSFRLSDDTIEQLENYAKAENRKLSNLVETILLEYLERRKREDAAAQ